MADIFVSLDLETARVVLDLLNQGLSAEVNEAENAQQETDHYNEFNAGILPLRAAIDRAVKDAHDGAINTAFVYLFDRAKNMLDRDAAGYLQGTVEWAHNFWVGVGKVDPILDKLQGSWQCYPVAPGYQKAAAEVARALRDAAGYAQSEQEL